MKERTKYILGALSAVIFIAMMILGIINKEFQTVFAKAVRICLECIGLG